jgi:hypothetical protein
MRTIETELPADHLELITVFLKANELDADISCEIDRNLNQQTIKISYNEENEDLCSKITYMSLRHLGFLNMLDDFLLKCGVEPYRLRHPVSKNMNLFDDGF